MSYSDAPAREAAWFNAVVPGLPSLGIAAGGQFDIVAAYPRNISQRSRQAYVWRSQVMDERAAKTGERKLTHRMVAEIVWSQIRPTSEANLDLALIDVALESVLARIRDPSHGGRFFDQPGPVVVTYGDVTRGLAVIDAPTSAGSAWLVRIAYDLVDRL